MDETFELGALIGCLLILCAAVLGVAFDHYKRSNAWPLKRARVNQRWGEIVEDR